MLSTYLFQTNWSLHFPGHMEGSIFQDLQSQWLLAATEVGTESQTSLKVPMLWDREEARGLWDTGVQYWW